MSDYPRAGRLSGLDASPSRAKLSLILLLYSLGLVLVITLAPFRFALPEEPSIRLSGGWTDLIANVLLFVPLGFLYPLTRDGERETSPARAFLLGLLLSGAIEAVQLFEVGRVTSLLDVLTNGAGAGAGTILQRTIARRIRVNARLVGRLSLELPLMGLVYLLVPLLWLGGLGVQEQPLRLLLLLALGLFGGRLLTAMQRHHFGPAGLLGGGGMGLATAGWMTLGTFPALIRHPVLGTALVATVALWTWVESARPHGDGGPDRRFEAQALRRAAPMVAVYLALLIVVPLVRGTSHWRWEVGLGGWASSLSVEQAVLLLEPIAALTVLGYLLAEARGRRELPFHAGAARLLLECGGVALAIEVGRGFQRAAGASMVQFALMTGAGLLGGWIYHLQRAHVQNLLAAGHRATEMPERPVGAVG